MDIDLQQVAGLPLALTATGELLLGDDVIEQARSYRQAAEARAAWADPGAAWQPAIGPQDRPLYVMHRGVSRGSDAGLLQSSGLRFDVTILCPGRIGPEYNKTVGHYHPPSAAGPTYPEVYELWHGCALYVLQRPGARPGTVAEVRAIPALPGDKVLIPPGFGHITVNTGTEPLVMANLVADGFASLYEAMQTCRGGAYYIMAAEGKYRPVPNPHYHDLPPLKWLPPTVNPDLGLSDLPLYLAFLNRPSLFNYLSAPTTRWHEGVVS